MKNRRFSTFFSSKNDFSTSQQSVNTKIIARLRHVLGHCRENDAFTRKVIVDFIVVDLAFCKHIKLEFIWFVIEGTIPKLLLS